MCPSVGPHPRLAKSDGLWTDVAGEMLAEHAQLIAAQAVVFVGPRTAGGFAAKGTGFFVEGPEGGVFIVTARHVLDSARAAGSLTVRIKRAADATFVDLSDFDDWAASARSDVAVHAFPQDALGIHSVLGASLFATDSWLADNAVGPGDEVFFLGLFAPLAGEQAGQPIARFGTISLKPGEPVPVRNPDGSFRRIVAWLIEARSWGGQSGSPAFVWLQPMRYPGSFVLPGFSGGDPGAGGELDAKDRVHLLGMVVGHFDLHQDVAFLTEDELKATVGTNSGVAIAVPASEIWQTLSDAA